jgi:hypothetical protein
MMCIKSWLRITSIANLKAVKKESLMTPKTLKAIVRISAQTSAIALIPISDSLEDIVKTLVNKSMNSGYNY